VWLPNLDEQDIVLGSDSTPYYLCFSSCLGFASLVQYLFLVAVRRVLDRALDRVLVIEVIEVIDVTDADCRSISGVGTEHSRH
jgi:hypothetical protein